MELFIASVRVLGMRLTIILVLGFVITAYITIAAGLKLYVGKWALGMLLAATLVVIMQWVLLHAYRTLGFGPTPIHIPLTRDDLSPAERLRFVCISDTHGKHRSLTIPFGDVLIHTGDFSNFGRREEVKDFASWLETLPHKHKIVVCGNHELSMDAEIRHVWHQLNTSSPEGIASLLDGVRLLNDETMEVEGVRLYGTPIMPRGLMPGAFERTDVSQAYSKIPPVDILLTHCPPWGFGDMNFLGVRAGSTALREAVERSRPMFHVFGHIHEGYGMYVHDTGTIFLNCSSSTLLPFSMHEPIVFDIKRKGPRSIKKGPTR